MDEMIKIQCPNCSTHLSVKPIPGIENKSVTCPVCKRKMPFVQYIKKGIVQNDTYNAKEETDLGNTNGNHQDPESDYGEGLETKVIGSLMDVSNGMTYPLRKGRNVIGRRASSSSADIQAAPSNNLRVSREHLVIDVRFVAGKGIQHYVSLYKEKVNKTIVNGMQLQAGEELILKNGNLIELPDFRMRFVLPDKEGTIPFKSTLFGRDPNT